MVKQRSKNTVPIRLQSLRRSIDLWTERPKREKDQKKTNQNNPDIKCSFKGKASRNTASLLEEDRNLRDYHCPVELSAMMKMLYNCTVQHLKCN